MKKKICTASRLIHALILTAGFTATTFAQTDFWEPVRGPLVGPVAAIIIDRNDVIFAGTFVGVGRSTDNGDSWRVDLFGIPVDALVINNAGHIFAGTLGNGVFRSTDHGDTWHVINNGLTQDFIFAVAVNSAQHIFAGTFDGGVFRSIDNGDTWEPVNAGLTETFVTALTSNSAGHLFAGTNAGVFRSIDNGDSWSFSNAGLPERFVFALAVNAADHLFAGTANDGVFRSTDNGDSWDGVNAGLGEVVDVRALAINAAGHLFAGATGLTTAGVFRSLNNGDNWEAVNAGLTRLRVLALGFDRQGRILAGTDGNGVFRSIGRTTSVDEDAGAIPPSFALAQNYPNPFWSGATSRSAGNPSTTIAFDLAKPAPVKLRVFDVTGREVAVLADQVFQAGTHKIVFTPNGLADGVYFYRIEAGEFAQTKKLTLLK
ncbi:T9SS type A sorting domain-containing protein [candidate division KSB1 bacterium]|nr:T9SS type A sorting domain-containing protein [candidate division KSB1 bacterium]